MTKGRAIVSETTTEPTLDAPQGDCGRRAFNAGLRYCGLPVVGKPLRYDGNNILDSPELSR